MTTPEPDASPEAQSPAGSVPEPPTAPPFEPDYSLVEYFKKSGEPDGIEYR